MLATVDKKLKKSKQKVKVRVTKSLLNNYDAKTYLSPFSTNVPLLYPLKRRFSDVFRGYRSGTLVENGLNDCIVDLLLLTLTKHQITLLSLVKNTI